MFSRQHEAGSLVPVGVPKAEEGLEYLVRGDEKTVESFLQTINPDLGYLVLAFEELGIHNEADLIIVRSWPPAVRRDFFERELVGKMNALHIQALNIRLGEMY